MTQNDQLSDTAALQQIRAWNDAMLRQPRRKVIVISPTGELDEQTRAQIAIAEAAGKNVQYVTRGANHAHPAHGIQDR